MNFFDQKQDVLHHLNLASYWIRFMRIRYMRALSIALSIAYNEVHLYVLLKLAKNLLVKVNYSLCTKCHRLFVKGW